MNQIIKNLAFYILGSDLAVKKRIQQISKNEYVTILNLHRVAELDGSAYRPLEPYLFSELLEFCNKHFALITFSELTTKQKKPKLILSFDDGYKDFIEVAVPILYQHKIKVNQNIIPKCIIDKLPPLNVIAQDYIGKVPLDLLKSLDVPDLDIKPHLSDRIKLGFIVSTHIKNKPMQQQDLIYKYLLPQFQNFTEFATTPMMSLNEIKQLIDIHEFGAHSFAHANMGEESNEYFIQDLDKCKEYFTNNLGKNVDIYAFPNGSYRSEQIDLAQKHGYKHILLVNNNFSNKNNCVHSRFGFYANSKHELYFRATGGNNATR